MFRFMATATTPQAGKGRQEMLPMLDWALPAVHGGPRRWSMARRELVFDGNTYTPFNGIVDWEMPLVAAIPASTEDWSFILDDSDGAWERLLTSHHLGTKVQLWIARALDGIASHNRMHLATGWVRRIVPVEDDSGRRMEVLLSNEIWNLDRDTALPMTQAAELDLDEDANSLAYAEKSATFEWGGRQGTRRDS